MSVTHLGSQTVGSVNVAIGLTLPGLLAALADLSSRVAALNATLSANVSVLAAPPDPVALAASIAEAAAGALSAVAALSAALPSSLVSANASLSADVAALGLIRDQLTAIVGTLTAAASAGGLHAFSVDSTAAAVGGELSALTGSGLPGGGLPSARVRGVVLLTESPGTFSALSTVLLTG